MIKNIIALIVIAVVLIQVILLVLSCRKYVVTRCCPKAVQSLVTTIERKLLFNSVLRAMLEIYFNTSIIMFI